MIKCLICDGPVTSFKHPKTQMLFHQCDICDVIFKDQVHFPSKEEEMKRYQEHHNDLSNKGYVNFLQGFIDAAITPYLKQGDLLDFGSGPTPVLAQLLREEGYHTWCYDPFFEPNFPDEKTFDMVVATEVVEHMHHPMQQFELIHSKIKPQGYFSVMTLLYPKDRHAFFNWFYLRDQTHIVFFSSKTYTYIAKKMNWKIIRDDGYRIVTFQKL